MTSRKKNLRKMANEVDKKSEPRSGQKDQRKTVPDLASSRVEGEGRRFG